MDPSPLVDTDLSDEPLGLTLTERGKFLASLDAQVQAARPVVAEPPPSASSGPGLAPAIVLLLGTGPIASAILAAGAFPLELRAEDATSETWCAGLARLARRVDGVLASKDWNLSPGGRDAVREAHRAGIPCFFGLESCRLWLAARARERLPAVLETSQRRDADELPTPSR